MPPPPLVCAVWLGKTTYIVHQRKNAGRRRKKNNQEAEWESEDVEIGSENGYDNFVGDNEDVPPPSPPLPVDANANAWHQDNWHDEPSQEGVEIADLVEL